MFQEVYGKSTMNIESIFNVPVLFGLESQGKIPIIQSMLAEGKTWKEIGGKIGWCPKTAEEHYKWYLEKKK